MYSSMSVGAKALFFFTMVFAVDSNCYGPVVVLLVAGGDDCCDILFCWYTCRFPSLFLTVLSTAGVVPSAM